MKKTLSTSQAMRYSRHILLADFDLEKQEILLNAKVAIIGMGGLGCATAQYLAASGIGNLTIVDDDKVEKTNLQRQILHFESDIGQLKVESASTTLSELNSDIDITCINKRLSADEMLSLAKKHDLLIDCTDNLDTRNLINHCCCKPLTPLVSGAAIRMEGQVFCVIPRKKQLVTAALANFLVNKRLAVLNPVSCLH